MQETLMKARRHRNANRFMLTWVLYGFLVYPLSALAGMGVVFVTMMVANMVQTRNVYNNVVEIIVGLLLGGAIGWAVGFLQTRALRDQLRWSADNWQTFSIIGGAIGGLLVFVLADADLEMMQYYDSNRLRTIMMLFVGVVGVFQWWALREAVKNASLWIVANLIAAFVFGSVAANVVEIMPVRYDDSEWQVIFRLIGIMVAPFLQAFITGTVMLTLFERFAYPVQRYGKRDTVVPKKPSAEASVWDEAI
jgi:hypothetical protein